MNGASLIIFYFCIPSGYNKCTHTSVIPGSFIHEFSSAELWWNSQSCYYCHKYCLNGQAVKVQHLLVWCSNHLWDDLVSFLPLLQQELEELFVTSCPAGQEYTGEKVLKLFICFTVFCLYISKLNRTWFWCACSFFPPWILVLTEAASAL